MPAEAADTTVPRAPSADPAPSAEEDTTLRKLAPPLLSKLSLASHIYGLKGVIAPLLWLRGWAEYFYPPAETPNIVKIYECRPHLPVRIFFPKTYDQTSQATLPTLFTIHGGGFCIGHIRDDDEWNRAFADSQGVLVIALNYSKAPAAPFPTAIYDLEVLLLATLADESLPIDRSTYLDPSGVKRSRTAILGFSAGGNLALSVSQLPSVRQHRISPAAAVSVYGYLDLSVSEDEKLGNRPFKTSLEYPRGDVKDGLSSLIPTFNWSYVPYGHDLRDPLLSPYFAPASNLPPFVGLIATELDLLAHESWRLACRLAKERGKDGFEVPDPRSEDPKERICGSEAVVSQPGELSVLDDTGNSDTRFAFEETWKGGGVKWLLVSDALHGFDNKHIRQLMGGKETIADAQVKTAVFMDLLGLWLKATVWHL